MTSNKTMAPQERRDLMLNTPVHSLILKMAFPTIISMLITSFYSLADTYFVSSLGTAATAAVGVNYSLDNIIFSAGSFLAVGANSYIARLLGARREHKASQVLSTAFFSALITGLFVLTAGFIFLDPMVRFLGATGPVVGYAKDYAGYILYAAPFMAANFVLNQCLRSEGSAIYSMIGMVSGAFLNLALDPLFIFVFKWGVKGASAATAISKLVSFLILITPYLKHSSLLRLNIRNVRYERDIVVEITKIGSPTFLRIGLVTVSTILLNNLAGQISESVLAAVSVANRVMNFVTAITRGFGQGYQPVIGFNWGAKRYDRVRQSYWFAGIVGALGAGVFAVILAIFAPQLMNLFTQTDRSMMQIGLLTIRLQALTLPIQAWGVVINLSYAGLGKARGAALMSISRRGICLIPMLLILPRFMGAQGLAVAQSAADVLSLLIALPLAVRLQREISFLNLEQKRHKGKL